MSLMAMTHDGPMAHEVTEAFDQGFLVTDDGHRVYWEAAGNPAGKPAILLHGGPGSGSWPRARRLFDPDRYLIVQFDQRQCGRSTPNAADPVVDLSTNTTAHLLADVEALRTQFDVDRWLLWGGSWGTNLAPAYAHAHPEHVSELALSSVVTTTHAEVDWVTRKMGRVFPEQWARFRDHVPEAERDGNLAAAYARLLASPDAAVHGPAALEWCRWEDTHVATYPDHTHDERYDDPAFCLCFARLVTHYWANAAFLDDGVLLRDTDRYEGIPIAMVHGQLDISGPPDIAWKLAQACPLAELTLIGDQGP